MQNIDLPDPPAPPEPKPVNEGINFVVALMIIAFVLTFIIVGANVLSGAP